MTLKDNIAADILMIMNPDEGAESITYNGVAMLAIPEIGSDNVKGNTFTRTGSAADANFWILEVDVPKPVGGDKIMHKGVKWTVARVATSAGGLQKVAVTGKESVYF